MSSMCRTLQPDRSTSSSPPLMPPCFLYTMSSPTPSERGQRSSHHLQITLRQEVLCKDCPDNNTAKSRCMECGENFCLECEDAHKRNKSTRSHRVVPFEEVENKANVTLKVKHFCTSHPDRFIECFCSNCEIMCCLMCAVIDHKGHDFKKLDDAAGMKIEELESLMTKVKKVSDKLKTAKSDCEAYVTRILEDKERSLAEINKSYEAIANLLRKRQSFLLREVEERSKRLVAIAKKKECLYDVSLAEIQSTQTYFSNAKSMTDEVGILQMFPSLKSTLCHISSHHSEDFEKFTQTIVFQTAEEENVQKYVSRYGDVKEVKDEGQRWSVKTKGGKIQSDSDFLLWLKRIHDPKRIPDDQKQQQDKKHAAQVHKESRTYDLEDEAIKLFSEKQINELVQLENKHDVAITVNKDSCQVSVYGLKTNVPDAMGTIYQMMRKVEKEKQEKEFAEQVQKLVQWYYMEINEDDDDNMVPYEMEVNVKLERAYTKDEEKQWTYQGFVFDFANWVEYPVGDPEDQAKMIRKDKIAGAGFNQPDIWDPMPPGKDVQLRQVPNRSEEFDNVQKVFVQALGNVTGQILRMDGIQSKTLYQQYQAKKQQIERQNPNKEVEKSLWHLTQTAATMSISSYGFNRSYCNKEQNALGEGAYFTTDAGYAARDRYAPADSQGKRYMFMCKVLTGSYTQGQPKIRVPPPKDPSKPEILYDSVVDDPANPQTFVIFNDTHAYPEYLISFQ